MSQVAQLRTASDIMQRDVVTVAPNDNLRSALELMTANHVTGLPVMDEKCRCIGLITASDILNYEQENADESFEDHVTEHFDPDTELWESIRLSEFAVGEFADVKVSEVMARDLIWVERTASLKLVAQKMVNQMVHRVLVMDSQSRLYGIISAFDFVRMAAEE